MDDRKRASCDNHTTVRAACEGREAAIKLAAIDQIDGAHLDGNGERYGQNCAPLANAGRDGGIANDRSARRIGCDLLEHLQPFRADAVIKLSETGDVAAGPGETVDEARANRIGYEHEYDRHGACRTPQWPDTRASRGEDDVRGKRDQFRRVFASVIF